jgi:hypothetical protein
MKGINRNTSTERNTLIMNVLTPKSSNMNTLYDIPSYSPYSKIANMITAFSGPTYDGLWLLEYECALIDHELSTYQPVNELEYQ